MTEQSWGRITAKGGATFVALVREALDECQNVTNPALEDRLPRQYVIEEHTPAEFRARKFVFADGTVNEGRVVAVSPTVVLWVNAVIVRRKPKRAKHIVRHEIAHVLPLSESKKAELMALMTRPDGKHPTSWHGGAYKGRPEEAHADTLAEAMSGIDSPWDDHAFFGLDVADSDVPKFLEITFRADPVPVPEPPPPPPPLPPTTDHQVLLAEIATALDGLVASLAAIANRARV